MRASLVSAALGAALTLPLAAPSAVAQRVGETVPEFTAVKWYNAPPMRFEDLRGKAILLEVFRTW